MTLSEELTWRGFVQDSTFTDLKQLDQGVITFYHGFDASADSQTVGNLAAMMADRVFLRHGHKALILAGGATSLVGDPGGKTSERDVQTEGTIARNIESAQKQLDKIMVGHEYTMVNNLDWTRDMNVLTFLRDIGKHFSMTPLVQRDYIAERMGEGGVGITYTEFSYTLLQGMDYLHLFDTYGCTLQLGGSDQWGNCLSGVELVRKARGGEVHALTLPLVINKATGVKFGKSEEGAIWLDPKLTSPYQFYQFWLNLGDEDIEYYLKVYTELPKEDVDALIAVHAESPHERKAQKRLAEEVTRLAHSQEDLEAVLKVNSFVFGEPTEITESMKEILRVELPTVTIDDNRLEESDYVVMIIDLLIELSLVKSKSEARKLIEAGAVKLDGEKVDSVDAAICSLDNPGLRILKRGKNSIGIIDVKG